jgi:hypothetical protein
MRIEKQPAYNNVRRENKMTKRAKFLYRNSDGSLEYSYNGHQYSINPNLYTSTAQQHRQEQSRIDETINLEQQIAEREANKKYRYEDTAEYGFEQFWKMVNE